jgi:phosphomevalonate kinase
VEKRQFTVKTPGSLLLLGEYFVLEKGGLGLAVAPHIYQHALLSLEKTDTPNFSFWGYAGEKSLAQFSCQSSSFSVIAADKNCITILKNLFSIFEKKHIATSFPKGFSVRIEVDSSQFFREGRKLGFGSSASLAVSLTALLFVGTGGENFSLPKREDIFRIALEVQRLTYGGSGYDIAISVFGGTGFFVGGKTPSLVHTKESLVPPIFLIFGEKSVSSMAAVARVRHYRRIQKKNFSRLYLESQADIQRLKEGLLNFSLSDWERIFQRGRRRALWIGEAIGVSAEIKNRNGKEVKAMGAGNEIGFSWDKNSGGEPLRISDEGVTISFDEQGDDWKGTR